MNKLTLVLIILLLSPATRAALVGEIKGGVLTWNSANVSNQVIIPHLWVNHTPETVTAWQPGIPTAPSSVVLKRKGSRDSVTLPINVVGIEYNMSNRDISGQPFFAGSATREGNRFNVGNSGISGAFYGKTLTYSNSQSPFTAFKPLIDLGSVLALLKGQPNGIYEGNIALTLPIVFQRTDTEQVTYRRKIVNLPVQITNRNTTCNLSPGQNNQTIYLGSQGADKLSSDGGYSTRVPITLHCNSNLINGTINFISQNYMLSQSSGIIGTNHQGGASDGLKFNNLGIELKFANKALGELSLNKPLPFVKYFEQSTLVYDLSVIARPVFIDAAAKADIGPYKAMVNINIVYD